MDPKVLAIIPARGGSKGLPGKNIKPLAGKPLIAHTIEVAINSQRLDSVVVSTDDDEIARISMDYGARVIKRPPELARDDSPTIDAINHVIESLEKEGKEFDIIVLLEPTSPLRKRDDIDNAISEFIKNMDHADALVSVGEVHMENPYIMKVIDNGYVTPFIESEGKVYQRQQLKKTYFPYGVIYLVKTRELRVKGTFYLEKTIPYMIERWQNYEIDDLYDFIAIEAILKNIEETEK